MRKDVKTDFAKGFDEKEIRLFLRVLDRAKSGEALVMSDFSVDPNQLVDLIEKGLFEVHSFEFQKGALQLTLTDTGKALLGQYEGNF